MCECALTSAHAANKSQYSPIGKITGDNKKYRLQYKLALITMWIFKKKYKPVQNHEPEMDALVSCMESLKEPEPRRNARLSRPPKLNCADFAKQVQMFFLHNDPLDELPNGEVGFKLQNIYYVTVSQHDVFIFDTFDLSTKRFPFPVCQRCSNFEFVCKNLSLWMAEKESQLKFEI